MGYPQSPCHHCDRRYVGCKSKCPDWPIFEQEKLDFHNKVAKEKFKYKEVDNFHYYSLRKASRR